MIEKTKFYDLNIGGKQVTIYKWAELARLWSSIEAEIYMIQQEIYTATKAKDMNHVWKLQEVIINSFNAKLLATRRVTADNRGKKTAGVDGVKEVVGNERFQLALSLEINTEASPIRRIWIPKPGKVEKRPLGIPTIKDRAKQALVLLALEPQWEAMFSEYDWYSNGFRPGRSANDCRVIICRWIQKERWVVDADISKCFDRINHDKLIGKLGCNSQIKGQVKSWLKAGILDKWGGSSVDENPVGTPQGGVLSPLLANIALMGLYAAAVPGFKEKRQPIGFSRYADDFVIICDDEKGAEAALERVRIYLSKWGLEISESKTRIVSTMKSFNFLGFEFKTYPCSWHHATLPRRHHRKMALPNNPKVIKRGTTYYSKPSKESVKRQKAKVKQFLKDNISAPVGKIVTGLAFITGGWARYFAVSNTVDTFNFLDGWLYNQLMRWAATQCKGSRRKAFKKYFITVGRKKWCFGYTTKNGEKVYVRRYESYSTPRATPINKTASPYDGNIKYWQDRLSEDNRMSRWSRKLLETQDGKCAYCGLKFTIWDEMEIDHIEEKASGGLSVRSNLALLHHYCHSIKTLEAKHKRDNEDKA